MYQCAFCNYKSMYVYNVTRHAKAKHGNQAGCIFRAPPSVSIQPIGNGLQHSGGKVGVNPTNFNVKLEEDQAKENNKLSNAQDEEIDLNTQSFKKDENPILLDSRFFCDTCPYATNRSTNLRSHKYRKHGSMKNIVKVKKMDQEIKQFGQ